MPRSCVGDRTTRDVSALENHLRELSSLEDCAQACCEFLIGGDIDLASIYLLRSGLLRRYASIGYWQVLDGFGPNQGVIATTTRTGQPHLIDVATSDVYLMAAQRAVSEACVPVWCEGESIGAINLEADTSIDASVLDEMARVAEVFGARITELGGVERPRGWQLLADRARIFTSEQDEREAIDAALSIATALSGGDSAMFVTDLARLGFRASASAGRFGEALMALPQNSLDEFGRWVTGPQSCYTLGDPEAPGFTGHDSLRVEGVSALAVSAVDDAAGRIGYLVVAHSRGALPDQDEVEQLEVLAALLAGAVRNARHVAELVALTRRDPLTGLGHSKAFDERLRELQEAEDRATAVFSIDIDHFKSVNDTRGHEAGDQLLKRVAAAMEQVLRSDDTVFRVGGDEFAVVLSVDDEAQAEAIGERLVAAVRDTGPRISVGGALAHYSGLSHRDVFGRADAALYEAKRRGRNQLVMASQLS